MRPAPYTTRHTCRQTLDSPSTSPSTVPCQACGIWRNVAPKIPSVRRRIVMAGFKLATYQSADGPRAGLFVDDTLFDAAKLTRKAGYATVIAILEDWKNAQALLKKATAGAAKGGRPLNGAKLLAPVR